MRIKFLLLAIFSANVLCAQLSPEPISIPMRDGQSLSAHLYRPDTINTYPTILVQTPYGKLFYQFGGLPLVGMDLANSNYAFVIVDWRCFFGSLSACTLNPDRGEDGFDAVEWIAQEPWSDGQVGTWGPSALGNVQFYTAREHPPHLVCAVPEVSGIYFDYRTYHPGGAIKTESFETLNGYFGGYGPVIANPFYNLIWQIAENSTMFPADIEVPMFMVGGWFDHGTVNNLAMIDTLRTTSDPSVRDQHKILIGPWVHGGTGQADLGSTIQGDLNFPMAEDWNDSLSLLFFDHHMRGISNGWDLRAPITYFEMGPNVWDTTSVWPPTDALNETWFLQDNNSILTTASQVGSFTYIYDPQDPSPTIGGKTLNLNVLQGPYDQTDSIESRNDVVTFTTPPFSQDLKVQGRIKVNLFVSSDRTDTDFCVRLTEVYPSGASILLNDYIQRMRFRDGYRIQDTAAVTPGTVYPITIELDDQANTFLAGNRLRLIVSSSNYPRYNRNMNTNGAMYPNNNPDTLVNALIATNTLFVGGTNPSSIELPVVPNPPMMLEEATQRHIELFPNPSNGIIFIQGLEQSATVIVMDLSGKEVYRTIVTSNAPNGIQLSHLNSGTYVVEVVDETGSMFTEKLVLSH